MGDFGTRGCAVIYFLAGWFGATALYTWLMFRRPVEDESDPACPCGRLWSEHFAPDHGFLCPSDKGST